jgi:hypothetical protein
MKAVGVMFFKYGTIYREALRGPRIDYCSLVNATKESNIWIYQNVRLIEATAPGLIHPCPYTVSIVGSKIPFQFERLQEAVVVNATFRVDLYLSVFPTGDYRSINYYATKSGESIVNLTMYFSFKTTNRDTFG